MKIAWIIVLVSAFTDFIIAGGGAYTSAVVAFPAQKFNGEQVALFLILGLIAAARTVQAALKATPEGAAGSMALTAETKITAKSTNETAVKSEVVPDPNVKEKPNV
jgi:hypothetical protein